MDDSEKSETVEIVTRQEVKDECVNCVALKNEKMRLNNSVKTLIEVDCDETKRRAKEVENKRYTCFQFHKPANNFRQGVC